MAWAVKDSRGWSMLMASGRVHWTDWPASVDVRQVHVDTSNHDTARGSDVVGRRLAERIMSV